MYCTKKIKDDIIWVGANDRRLAMFEGVYSVPDGVSYNSYLVLDEKTVLFDTVDKAVGKVFFENVAHTLGDRELDYVVIQHVEPDHSATLLDLIRRYPGVTVVCNQKSLVMLKQFFDNDLKVLTVKEGETLETGKHCFRFVMAPMVHWPEVMVTYDETDGILFSADAFGSFGALNGAIFADEVDFMRDYLDEARRYYCNIVGKYGTQVTALLNKASSLKINMICPLHGFVWRTQAGDFIEKYSKWGSYTPEENGVMIAYASVYGNTENAAEVISSRLRDAGIKTVMFDTSVTPSSEIVAAAFKYSHLIFASTTYNAGIFITMDELLRDLAAHNISGRTVAFVENGSWAPTSGKLMREILAGCKNMNFIENTLSLRSSLKKSQSEEIDALVNAVIASFPAGESKTPKENSASAIEAPAMFKLSYGLFVLTARDGEMDNGCIINTAQLLTDSPKRMTIAVNKNNLTHDMIIKTGQFNVSVLTEKVPFDTIEHFGFSSGRSKNKFENADNTPRSSNGIYYIPYFTNAFISAKVISACDYGTHTLFVAEVTEAHVLSGDTSVTYDYYFKHIKPKPQPKTDDKKGFVCKVCGYVYEGDTLPDDFICPICKHGAEDFEPLK